MYYSLSELPLYLFFLYFLVAAFFSWFVPGWLVVSLIKMKDRLAEFALAIPVGIALWGVQGYVLGYLNLRIITYLYVLILLVIFIKSFKEFKNSAQLAYAELQSLPLLLLLGILVSSFLQIFGHVISGLVRNGAVEFYFLRSSVMHLAYIQSIAQNFPPLEPGAVNLPLENYHYWSDLVLADIARVWQVPVMHLFFQYAPIVLSLIFTLLSARLLQKLSGSLVGAAFLVFLFTFGADASYIFTLLLHGSLGSEVATIDGGLVHYFNIPQVFARLLFVAALFPLLSWWKKPRWESGLLSVLLIATLFGFKVYYGIYAALGFSLVVLVKVLYYFFLQLPQQKIFTAIKNTFITSWLQILLVIVLGAVSLSIYLPPNKSAGGLFYSPLEWPKLFLGAEQINFSEWWLRMQVYEEANNVRNIFVLNGVAVVMAFVSLYGTRLLGLIPSFKTFKQLPKELLLFLLPANILFYILGLFTMQETGGLNTFNFFIVPVVSMNLLAALNISKLSNKLLVIVIPIFVLLTVPRSLQKLSEFITSYQDSKTSIFISADEMAALTYARNNLPPNAVLQSAPTNSQDKQTPYVSFFSNRRSYVAGTSMLESHNQPYEEREVALEQALLAAEPLQQLRNLGITYMYFVDTGSTKHNFPPEVVVFQNESVAIVSTQHQIE